MNEERKKPIKRSERFIMHFQIEAICESLQFLIQCNQKPGPSRYQLLKKLLEDSLDMTRGRCVSPPPHLDEAGSPADWLVVANNLRGISLAFLSPEEREDSQKFGFAR